MCVMAWRKKLYRVHGDHDRLQAVFLTTGQASKSKDKLLGKGMATFIWKADRPGRWQVSVPKNHFYLS